MHSKSKYNKSKKSNKTKTNKSVKLDTSSAIEVEVEKSLAELKVLSIGQEVELNHDQNIISEITDNITGLSTSVSIKYEEDEEDEETDDDLLALVSNKKFLFSSKKLKDTKIIIQEPILSQKIQINNNKDENEDEDDKDGIWEEIKKTPQVKYNNKKKVVSSKMMNISRNKFVVTVTILTKLNNVYYVLLSIRSDIKHIKNDNKIMTQGGKVDKEEIRYSETAVREGGEEVGVLLNEDNIKLYNVEDEYLFEINDYEERNFLKERCCHTYVVFNKLPKVLGHQKGWLEYYKDDRLANTFTNGISTGQPGLLWVPLIDAINFQDKEDLDFKMSPRTRTILKSLTHYLGVEF